MCLIIDLDARERIATKDITCYKIVENRNSRCKRYLTYYMNKPIVFGVMYRSIIRILPHYDLSQNRIENALHSFKTKTDAFDLFKKNEKTNRPQYLVRCTIPKGAKYYEGLCVNSRSYASNRIRYDEIVHTWKFKSNNT